MTRFTLAVSILAASTPLLAHHSFAAEYDRNKPFTVRGTVTKVEWMNPHAYFYLDVKDETGKVTNWAFELGNLSTLMRGGWRKTTMKIGDVVTVDAFRAKDGSHLGNGRSVVMADGTKIFAGSSAGEYAGN
jgi:DNA/RNA endonuclease YhcR with UshA esterase domain